MSSGADALALIPNGLIQFNKENARHEDQGGL